MREPVHVAWTENEAATKLKGISPPAMLLMTSRASTDSGMRVVRPQYMQNICTPQTGRTVSQPVIVNEQRKSNAGFFPKKPRIVPIAQPDCCQFCTLVLECGFVFAQLRDVLTAEDSAVVTEKDDHRRLLFP